jgi:hypothetical protein
MIFDRRADAVIVPHPARLPAKLHGEAAELGS